MVSVFECPVFRPSHSFELNVARDFARAIFSNLEQDCFDKCHLQQLHDKLRIRAEKIQIFR